MNASKIEPNSDIANAIALLTQQGFRLVEQFEAPTRYQERDVPEERLALGVVLDTETTGTNAAVDALIELGMVFFEYDPETGVVYRIVEVFNELQDPGIPIPAEASAVNGITDDMVKDKQIDGEMVTHLVSLVSVVIAHNAGFDRQICERYWPIFETLPWACSFRQVPWAAEDISSGKLDYIAYRRGFHFSAHRAEEDCRALLHVLQAPFAQTGMSTLKQLLGTALASEKRIWAVNAPFAVKDKLSARGYRWSNGNDGTEKAWNIQVTDENYEAELAWLKSTIYGNQPSSIVVDEVTALNRFSTRRGSAQRKYL